MLIALQILAFWLCVRLRSDMRYGRAVCVRLRSGRSKVQISKVKSDTVLPTARRRCNFLQKELCCLGAMMQK